MVMKDDEVAAAALRLAALRAFQERFGAEVADVTTQSPALALHSLHQAAQSAPVQYRDYLGEAVACYEGGQYRAAILMVWAATVQHLYDAVATHHGGLKALEAANASRYGASKAYRTVSKGADLLYLSESQFIQLAEDAGLINRNARQVLTERLNLRNRCGHPTGYRPGREEAVVFIESLVLNILSNSWLLWK